MIVFFLFYNYASGKQAKLAFSDEFKHCNVITFDGEIWLGMDFDYQGLQTRKIQVKSVLSLVRAVKHISTLSSMLVADIGLREKISWKPWIVRSCNEFARYASGIDVGFTFNPKHLYNKMLRYDTKRNYEILYSWRRTNGIVRRR